MRKKKRSLGVLVGILGAVLLAGACHKKVVGPPAPTAAATATAGPHRDTDRRAEHR